MIYLRKWLCAISLLLVITACNEDKPKESNPAQKNETSKKSLDNLNISIVLDLSDRINPKKYPNESMEFYQRDAAYIKSVAEAFVQHLRQKKVRQMNDRIQVFFDPEPNNPKINSISNQLKFDVNRYNASLDLLDSIQDVYSSKPIEIYKLAIEDNQYVGSDTWGFFKGKVKDYCIDPEYRNILVLLTDGYMYHKDRKRKDDNKTNYIRPQDIRSFKLTSSKWDERYEEYEFGFIPATENLENLEILVLGINPDSKNAYEGDVIDRYWQDWFNSMDVQKFELETADLPSNLDKIIKEFINQAN